MQRSYDGPYQRNALTAVVSALVALLLAACGPSQIYRSPEHESKILSIYGAKLDQWPRPFDTVRVRTSHASTHVTITGDPQFPPLVLLHAMGVTSMMWLDNVDTLRRHFRVYAVDMPGDIGKSTLHETRNALDDADKITEWLNELLDSLNIQKASFAGASYGGWSTMKYAIRQPQRVDKVALLAPMGIANVPFAVILKILWMVWFPTESKRGEMIDWTLGDSPHTRRRFVDHMQVATECRGFLATPWELSDEELGRIRAPVLLLLGSRDNIVSPASEAKVRASRLIPNVQAHILQTAGHMLNSDVPRVVDSLLVDFLHRPSSPPVTAIPFRRTVKRLGLPDCPQRDHRLPPLQKIRRGTL